MDEKTLIGNRIKDLRKSLKLSQQELADKVGLKSKATISTIENGKQGIRRADIEKYAKALHTTPQYIMGWTDNDNLPIGKAIGAALKENPARVADHLNKYIQLTPPNQDAVDAMCDVLLSQQTKNDT